MEAIGYILTTITWVYLWDHKLRQKLFMTKTDTGYRFRSTFFKWLDGTLIGELLNCELCLCFWASIILYFCLGDIYLLSLPLAYQLIHKIIT